MKKGNTFMFGTFLLFALVLLAAINFFKDYLFIIPINNWVAVTVSVVLIFFIISLFIYREDENKRIIDQFIIIITHKFRTPLTGIRWTINMLQKDLSLLEKKDLLMEMQKANERLMEIVDLLISFAKFDKKLEYAFVAVSMREIVDCSLNKYSLMAKNKNINFMIDSGKGMPLVVIDKAKVQYVVDMLIDNAVKYTPEGGSIKISFDMDSQSITLRVADTGMGFGYFDGKKIFKNFYRSESAKKIDAEGLGLGLYSARKIALRHKGKLWAESPGHDKGSTFYFKLPIPR